MKTYQHTQFGSAIVVACGAIGFGMLIAALSSQPMRSLWIGGAILLVSAAFFSTLTITIEDGMLSGSFGPGLIRKRVKVADIASVCPIPVRWWYGWGIHLTPRGWLYNVSGWKAVEITLRDGRRFCLGTDQPEDLQKAIEEASV